MKDITIKVDHVFEERIQQTLHDIMNKEQHVMRLDINIKAGTSDLFNWVSLRGHLRSVFWKSKAFICNQSNVMAIASLPDGGRGSIFISDDFSDRGAGDEMISLQIVGNKDEARALEKDIYATFSPVTSYVQWSSSDHGDDIRIPLRSDMHAHDVMFPFVDGGIKAYYERFMASGSNVLIMIGPPGTGKTSFIRGMLQHLKSNAFLTYDERLLDKDSVFSGYLQSNSDIFVIEDADTLLQPRSEGNDLMRRFLSVGDGLISMPQKKLVFTTNLENTQKIDPALMRTGRCFDVLQFRKLKPQEQLALSSELSIDINHLNSEDHTLSDIMNTRVIQHENRAARFFSERAAQKINTKKL